MTNNGTVSNPFEGEAGFWVYIADDWWEGWLWVADKEDNENGK